MMNNITKKLKDFDEVVSHSQCEINGKIIVGLSTKESPEAIGLPKEIDGIPVEYQYEGKVSFENIYDEKHRPLVGGVGIGPEDNQVGTYGGPVFNAKDELLLLTNYHVLEVEGSLEIGASVYQPAYGMPNNEKIGEVYNYSFGAGTNCDAAIVNPNESLDILSSSMLRDDGVVTYPENIFIPIYQTELQEKVDANTITAFKYGRTTGYTEGTVASVYETVYVEGIMFENVIRISTESGQFSDSGDSGSRVMIDDGVIGLHFAGSEEGDGFAIPSETVENELSVSFYTSTDMHTLLIKEGSGGSTSPQSGTHNYNAGEEVVVRAIPDSNNVLIGWRGDYS